ncbi:MAG: beta-glucosidase [Deltaproteobacteria bacterium]|nr:beta-glucosidase [Deltaproteobacteria bacterium]
MAGWLRVGVATASYQIEGAVHEDGRSPSVWDTFSHTPGRVLGGDTGDLACDHYHRVVDDVALIASLGVKVYRFSIAWPRVLPDGTGRVEERGLDFYRRLLDELARHGIEPRVTLYHWDHPQALEQRYGGWRARTMAHDFADYVAVVVKALGDRVTRWTTMNEIACFTHFSFGATKPGIHAPGLRLESQREVWQTAHHALLGHGLATQVIRALSARPCQVSLVDNLAVPVPYREAPEDVAAAGAAFGVLGTNGGILVPALTGRYEPRFEEAARARGEMPVMDEGDLATIAQPLDELGLNVYTGVYVRAASTQAGFETLPFPPGYPKLDMPWLDVVPDALYWAPRHVVEQLGFRGRFFVSENGCAARDEPTGAGEVLDLDRIAYLRGYLRQLVRATAEGLPVTGYCLWSLLDNFEWSWGYAKRFGLVYVDYPTQRRIPKASAAWYSECIRQNRVV